MAVPVGAHADRGGACQRNAECRKHGENGVRMSEKKDYAAALREFQAAYDIQPDTRLLINIGRSLYRLDRSREALDHYARYRKLEIDIDPATDKTLKGYEADALATLPPSEAGAIAAPPPPSSRAARLTPGLPIALLATGGAFLIVGFGFGGAAIAAGRQISDHGNAFTLFTADTLALEQRGQAFERGAIAFDTLGALALTAGAVWTGLWLYQRKTGMQLIGRSNGSGIALFGVY